MTNINKKIELKFDEDNELSFQVSFEGTVSDLQTATNPIYRFAIIDVNDCKDKDSSNNDYIAGWIFPVEKLAGDVVTVRIPAVNKFGFKPKKIYKGILEVILGRLYFSPAEIEIEFIDSIKVKVNSIYISNSKNEEDEEELISSIVYNSPITNNYNKNIKENSENLSLEKTISNKNIKKENAVLQNTNNIQKNKQTTMADQIKTKNDILVSVSSVSKPVLKKKLINDKTEKQKLKEQFLSMFKAALK